MTSMMQLELMARALRLCRESALLESWFAVEMGGNHRKTVSISVMTISRKPYTKRIKHAV